MTHLFSGYLEITRWVQRTWDDLAYHRSMVDAITLRNAQFMGDKLVTLKHTGRFSTDFLPAEMAAAAPEEVGALVVQTVSDDSESQLGYRDYTFSIFTDASGESGPYMQATFQVDVTADFPGSSHVGGWKDVEPLVTEWIWQTWHAHQQQQQDDDII